LKKDKKVKFSEKFKETISDKAVPIEEIIRKEFKKYVFEEKEKKY
jgi:hypothetical protein